MTHGPVVPAALLRDGVACVDADGALRAVTAAAEPWLREHPTLASLPLDDEQRARLADGAPVVARALDGWWELQLRNVDQQRWLTIADVTASERDGARRREVARARALASIAGSIAHDLNNQFNAALGLVGQAELFMTSARDQALLGELEAGIRAGGRIALVLARWLVRDRGAREDVAPQALLDAVLAVAQKAFANDRVELRVDAAPELPRVRTVAIEAEQAVMHGLMAALDAAPRAVLLRLDRADGTAARRHVRLSIEAAGARPDAADALVAVVQGRAGLLGRLRERTALEGVLDGVLAQRRIGGALEAERVADGVRLHYGWPVAPASREG